MLFRSENLSCLSLKAKIILKVIVIYNSNRYNLLCSKEHIKNVLLNDNYHLINIPHFSHLSSVIIVV